MVGWQDSPPTLNQLCEPYEVSDRGGLFVIRNQQFQSQIKIKSKSQRFFGWIRIKSNHDSDLDFCLKTKSESRVKSQRWFAHPREQWPIQRDQSIADNKSETRELKILPRADDVTIHHHPNDLNNNERGNDHTYPCTSLTVETTASVSTLTKRQLFKLVPHLLRHEGWNTPPWLSPRMSCRHTVAHFLYYYRQHPTFEWASLAPNNGCYTYWL